MAEIRLGKDIHIVANKIKRKMDSATYEYDLTHTQFHMLLFLYGQKDEVYQKDIENSFNLRRSTISKMLSLLEKKGLIKKQAVQQDARLKKIILTKKGIEQLNLVKDSIKRINENIVSQIDPQEFEIFYKVLNELSELAD